MRGTNEEQQAMMFVVSMEGMIPKDHPLRAIKKLADRELARLDETFNRMYGRTGRPSIPPERLLKASLLMALFSVRSERQLCEQLSYNFMYRWFLNMGVNEEPFDASVFAKNRERLMKEDVGRCSSTSSCGRRASRNCCRVSTLPWTAHCWRQTLR